MHQLLDVHRREELARLRRTSVCRRTISHIRQNHDKRHLPHVEYRLLKTLANLKLAMEVDTSSSRLSYHQEASLSLMILTIGLIRRKRNTDPTSSSNLASLDTRKVVMGREGMANSRVTARVDLVEECESTSYRKID